MRSARAPAVWHSAVDVLLHGVAHVDEGGDRGLGGGALGVVEHAPDLGQPAVAGDAGHQPLEPAGVGDEARGARLAVAAEVDELHLEPARLRGGVEHGRLQLAGEVPGRLTAHGGVEGEDEPPAAGLRSRRAGARLGEEGRDVAAAGRRGLVGVGDEVGRLAHGSRGRSGDGAGFCKRPLAGEVSTGRAESALL